MKEKEAFKNKDDIAIIIYIGMLVLQAVKLNPVPLSKEDLQIQKRFKNLDQIRKRLYNEPINLEIERLMSEYYSTKRGCNRSTDPDTILRIWEQAKEYRDRANELKKTLLI